MPEDLARYRQELPDLGPVRPGELEARPDPLVFEPPGATAGDAGDRLHRQIGQQRLLARGVDDSPRAARLDRLADDLGQRPAPADPDSHRHPDLLQYPLAVGGSRLLQRLAAERLDLEEELVDGVEL